MKNLIAGIVCLAFVLTQAEVSLGLAPSSQLPALRSSFSNRYAERRVTGRASPALVTPEGIVVPLDVFSVSGESEKGEGARRKRRLGMTPLARKLLGTEAALDRAYGQFRKKGRYPIEERWIESFDGTRIHYLIGGKPRAKNAIVFLHSWTGTLTHWIRQIEPFEEDHQLIFVDLRGHGRSELGPQPPSDLIRSIAADVAEILVKERIEKTALIGHSLGGMVAMAFFNLHRNEKIVTRLVLLNTTPNVRKSALIRRDILWGGLGLCLAALRRIPGLDLMGTFSEEALRRSGVLRSAARGFLNLVILRGAPRQFFDEEIYPGTLTTRVSSILYNLQAISSFEGEEILPEIDVPTLIVEGGKDLIVLSDKAFALFRQANNPHFEFFTLKKTGHFSQASQRLKRRLKEFLSGKKKGRGTSSDAGAGGPIGKFIVDGEIVTELDGEIENNQLIVRTKERKELARIPVRKAAKEELVTLRSILDQLKAKSLKPAHPLTDEDKTFLKGALDFLEKQIDEAAIHILSPNPYKLCGFSKAEFISISKFLISPTYLVEHPIALLHEAGHAYADAQGITRVGGRTVHGYLRGAGKNERLDANFYQKDLPSEKWGLQDRLFGIDRNHKLSAQIRWFGPVSGGKTISGVPPPPPGLRIGACGVLGGSNILSRPLFGNRGKMDTLLNHFKSYMFYGKQPLFKEQLGPGKVLVVNDDPRYWRLVEPFLEGEGFTSTRVTTRAELEKTIESIRLGKTQVDLVFGFKGTVVGSEAADLLRNLADIVPVIVLWAKDDDEERKAALPLPGPAPAQPQPVSDEIAQAA